MLVSYVHFHPRLRPVHRLEGFQILHQPPTRGARLRPHEAETRGLRQMPQPDMRALQGQDDGADKRHVGLSLEPVFNEHHIDLEHG